MKRVAVILCDGFEEVEAITPIDILRRAGVDVCVVGVGEINITGAHGITIIADDVFDYFNSLNYDGIVFAGGMKNAISLSQNTDILKLINYYFENDKLVCGICATPAVVFSMTEILKNKKFTCYPSEDLINLVSDGIYENSKVVYDKILTSQSPMTATDFALAIVQVLGYDSSEIEKELKGI